jgi:hypothetical protein
VGNANRFDREAVAAALDDPTAEEDVRGVVAVRIEMTVD